ncbi:MAG TPA: hypothetical protein VH987_07240 [Candidatus Limnocylindria bacterium]
MFVAALLVMGAIGLAVLGSLPRPQPQPTPPARAAIRVEDFVVPFTYSLPAMHSGRLASVGGAEPAVIYATGRTFSRGLEVFLVTGGVHNCLSPAAPGSVGFISVSEDPSAFLLGLRDIAEIGLQSIRQTTLGNLPAWGAEVDPTGNTCSLTPNQLHETGLGIGRPEPTLDRPGRLIVARIEDTTIAALIWATSEEELSEWLPIGQAYVDSFVFSAVR